MMIFFIFSSLIGNKACARIFKFQRTVLKITFYFWLVWFLKPAGICCEKESCKIASSDIGIKECDHSEYLYSSDSLLKTDK